MGVIQVTARPSYYAEEDAQEMLRIRKYGIPTAEELEAQEREEEIAWTRANRGKLSVRLQVGGISDSVTRYRQKRILEVMNKALREKGRFVRQGNDGFYRWERFTLHDDVITSVPFLLEDMEPILTVLQALDEEEWCPENDITIGYHLDQGDLPTLCNFITILESRKPLIEEALSLTDPLMIMLDHGVALGVALSAFSYTAVEAAAYLLEQGWKMAVSTGKARMKPCNMSNPKYQMRSWLLRLGFIGEKFERPRKTLLEGLAGDVAFFDAEQKKVAAAKRKARKLNNASA